MLPLHRDNEIESRTKTLLQLIDVYAIYVRRDEERDTRRERRESAHREEQA